MTLLRTPLFESHVALGARIVEFGGWDMPVQYSNGVLAEHAAVRQGVGMFDVSHMGRIRLTGENAGGALDRVVTSNVGTLRVGRARYGLICNESGGILDDVVVMRLANDEFLMVCNAASWDRITDWLGRHCEGVSINHERDETSMMAVQGPGAVDALQALVDIELGDVGRFACRAVTVAGTSGLVSRTGYTGEDGFEVILPAGEAARVWQTLVEERGVAPCGLAARDVLRLEAGLMLYGQDMDDTVTPLEAGLDRFVNLDKDFLGVEELREQAESGVERRITGLTVEGRSAPRHGYTVRTGDGRESLITSGAYSPVLGYGVALAYLPIDVTEPGNVVDVDIRGRTVQATTVPLPFLQANRG